MEVVLAKTATNLEQARAIMADLIVDLAKRPGYANVVAFRPDTDPLVIYVLMLEPIAQIVRQALERRHITITRTFAYKGLPVLCLENCSIEKVQNALKDLV